MYIYVKYIYIKYEIIYIYIYKSTEEQRYGSWKEMNYGEETELH